MMGNDEASRFRELLAAERRSADLYDGLAEAARGERREILNQLAAVERRHAEQEQRNAALPIPSGLPLRVSRPVCAWSQGRPPTMMTREQLAAMTDEEILAHYRHKHGDPYMPLSMAKKIQREDFKWRHVKALVKKRAQEGKLLPGPRAVPRLATGHV
jgi:hypothetical protein